MNAKRARTAKQKKKHEQSEDADAKQVRDSNELLALMRQEIARWRSSGKKTWPKKLKIPEPE